MIYRENAVDLAVAVADLSARIDRIETSMEEKPEMNTNELYARIWMCFATVALAITAAAAFSSWDAHRADVTIQISKETIAHQNAAQAREEANKAMFEQMMRSPAPPPPGVEAKKP